MDARVIATWDDEFEFARDVLVEYWSAYGYYGDEWRDAWDNLDISESAKRAAWSAHATPYWEQPTAPAAQAPAAPAA
jgi:hypothetical protein